MFLFCFLFPPVQFTQSKLSKRAPPKYREKVHVLIILKKNTREVIWLIGRIPTKGGVCGVHQEVFSVEAVVHHYII